MEWGWGRATVALALGCWLLATPPAWANHAGPLAGQWNLDCGQPQGTPPDSSGHGLDGSVDKFGVRPIADGRFAGAFRFGSTGEGTGRISVPQSAQLEPANVTLLGWVRRNGTPGS